VRFEIGVPVSLDLVYHRFYKTLTKAAGFPIHALGNDGELGQCRVECVFELPRPIAAILRNSKRANSPAANAANSPQPNGCKFPAPALVPYNGFTIASPQLHAEGLPAASPL